MNDHNRNVPSNRDALTGAAGAHPVGTGFGAAVAGLNGKRVAEALALNGERSYCGKNLTGRDYGATGSSVDDYGPAYGFGLNARGRYPGRRFDDVESEMSRDWATSRGASILSWEWARHAARDAWNRIVPSS